MWLYSFLGISVQNPNVGGKYTDNNAFSELRQQNSAISSKTNSPCRAVSWEAIRNLCQKFELNSQLLEWRLICPFSSLVFMRYGSIFETIWGLGLRYFLSVTGQLFTDSLQSSSIFLKLEILEEMFSCFCTLKFHLNSTLHEVNSFFFPGNNHRTLIA